MPRFVEDRSKYLCVFDPSRVKGSAERRDVVDDMYGYWMRNNLIRNKSKNQVNLRLNEPEKEIMTH